MLSIMPQQVLSPAPIGHAQDTYPQVAAAATAATAPAMARVPVCKKEGYIHHLDMQTDVLAQAAQLHTQCTCGACISRDCSSWMPLDAIRSWCALSAADMQR